MKMIYILIVATFFAVPVFSQGDTSVPPYQRFPTLPPMKLLLTDSTTYFTKDDFKNKTASMIVLFNPDCDHCQKETEELTQHIDRFKNIQIVMASFAPLEKIKEFSSTYDLEKYKNITVGQDYQFFLSTFYMIKNLPFHAFYNKKKELISVFEGTISTTRMLSELEK